MKRSTAYFRPLLTKGLQFFSSQHYSTNFDQYFKIVESKRAGLPKFWSSVDTQLKLIKQAREQNRPLTQEEMSQLDFEPTIARIYDTDPTVDPLLTVYDEALDGSMDTQKYNR